MAGNFILMCPVNVIRAGSCCWLTVRYNLCPMRLVIKEESVEYRVLGRTGVKVSRLCFGTMSFGSIADENESAKMFHRCRDLGINFFDCANVYAGGRSEEILGKLIADCRDDLVITSKVASGMRGLTIVDRHVVIFSCRWRPV